MYYQLIDYRAHTTCTANRPASVHFQLLVLGTQLDYRLGLQCPTLAMLTLDNSRIYKMLLQFSSFRNSTEGPKAYQERISRAALAQQHEGRKAIEELK